MGELLALVAPPFDAAFSGIALYTLLLSLGFFVGILTGLFGVGGGFLVVPLLNVLLGIPYSIAVGSSLSFIIGTSSSALPGHLRLGNVEPAAVLYLSIGSGFGAFLGDILQDFLIYSAAGGDAARYTHLMHVIFIVLLLVTAVLVVRSPKKTAGGLLPLQKLPLPPHVDLLKSGILAVSIPGLLVIGLLIGLLTGLLGVGGGVLFMPILLIVVGLSPRRAAGTSLGVVLVASTVGAAKKLFSDIPKISLPVTMALLVGSSIGVQIGIKLSIVLQGDRIRRYFALVILAAVLLVLYDLLGF
jgi:uncharacterized membrane protein YfcA